MSERNPFYRGLSNLSIVRKVMIDYGSEFPMAYRSVHSLNADASDYSLIDGQCIFNDDVALIYSGNPEPDAQEDRSDWAYGTVRSIVYELIGKCGDDPVHVGDYPTADSAKAVIEQVKFQSGFFSRCWEICNSHVTQDAIDFLFEATSDNTPLFEAFTVDDQAVGVKLICTPWTDENLRNTIGQSSAADLKQEMVDAGVPESLIELLFLAAQADTRILILDSNASTLDGLPVFDW